MATGGLKELEKYLQLQCHQLCEIASNEVYEAINFFLDKYYREYDPFSYQRSYDLLHSAFKTEVKRVGNSFQAIVGIDYESLDNYRDATGWEVVNWGNQGSHGGIDIGSDTRIFDDAIDSTINNGQLIKDCIDYLRSKGLTVIT